MESRTCDFLVAEKIQATCCPLGEKNALLEGIFVFRYDNFLDRQITGIGSPTKLAPFNARHSLGGPIILKAKSIGMKPENIAKGSTTKTPL